MSKKSITKPNRTTVSLSRKNYNTLVRLGTAGESLNDVMTRLFKQLRLEQEISI
jgi:hypothetical protein